MKDLFKYNAYFICFYRMLKEVREECGVPDTSSEEDDETTSKFVYLSSMLNWSH